VPRYSFVRISVFDVQGKEIERLAEQNLTPGEYEVKWDASKYSSGIYFYSLLAGEYAQTKKMILVK